jgi:hypothetical protein
MSEASWPRTGDAISLKPAPRRMAGKKALRRVSAAGQVLVSS